MLINFDFDGVIADSFDQLLELCTDVQRAVGEGHPPTAVDFRTIKNLTFSGLAEQLGICTGAQAFVQQAIKQQQMLQAGDVRFFPGIAATLKRLSEKHQITIISASSSQMIGEALAVHGAADMVRSISGGEGGGSKKDSLLSYMQLYSATPRQACMVGDTINDIRQGREAGVVTVAVGWGFQSRELLLQEAPDHYVETLGDLEKLFK